MLLKKLLLLWSAKSSRQQKSVWMYFVALTLNTCWQRHVAKMHMVGESSCTNSDSQRVERAWKSCCNETIWNMIRDCVSWAKVTWAKLSLHWIKDQLWLTYCDNERQKVSHMFQLLLCPELAQQPLEEWRSTAWCCLEHVPQALRNAWHNLYEPYNYRDDACAPAAFGCALFSWSSSNPFQVWKTCGDVRQYLPVCIEINPRRWQQAPKNCWKWWRTDESVRSNHVSSFQVSRDPFECQKTPIGPRGYRICSNFANLEIKAS